MLPATSGRHKAALDTSALVQQLQQKWPCREQLIEELARRVSSSSGAPVFIFGPPATGKTAIVRDILRQLGVRHAYVNCQEVTKPKPFLSSIIHQLKGGKRRRDEGYDCASKCDSISEFLQLLPGVVNGRTQGGRPSVRSSSSSSSCSSGPRDSWLVVDHSERIAGSELLTALLKMRGSSGVRLGLVLISSVPWSSGRYLRDTGNVVQPDAVLVPAYRDQQLQKILEHRRQQAQGGAAGDGLAYRLFLQQLVPALCRATNNLLDVQAAASFLYPRYQEHQRRILGEGRQPQAKELFQCIRQHVQLVYSNLDLHKGALAKSHRAPDSGARPSSAGAAGSSAGASERASTPHQALAFELPFLSKYLLVAAYIASRNKPTTDRQIFDTSYMKRSRKDGQASDRAAEAALEARLRGPHSFPLERLLHIFYALYQQQEEDEGPASADGEEEREGGGPGDARGAEQEAWAEMQQGEVLMQLATLVSLRLLSQTSGDVLEGALYRCNLSEDMATALASNIHLRLQDYLRLG